MQGNDNEMLHSVMRYAGKQRHKNTVIKAKEQTKMKKSNTKRSLIASVTSLVLCCALLIGTTFAWFTDSVSTGKNTIASGNLDVELYQVKDSTETKVDENTKLFNENALWEPGYTEVVYLKVANEGSLALKYQFAIDVVYTNLGKTADGQDIDLSQYLRFAVVENASAYATREEARAAADAAGTQLISNGFASTEGHLSADAKSDLIAIVVYMPEEVGNEANHNGTNIPTIDLGLQLVATQDTVESDSFDNRYDLTAEYPDAAAPSTATVKTAEELRRVLTAFTDAGSGDSVVTIDEDITLAEGETWTPVSVDGYHGAGVITINGNGHTIKGLNAPLIAGGFAGESGIVINELTIDNAMIDDIYADQGLGAFVCSIDSMPKIELNKCHLTNSTITSTSGARVGGLIGWTAGYDNPNDGPVDTYITVTGCSVENCTITAAGSVGAIIGHAGSNPATYHMIKDCEVKDTSLHSTDDGGWRVGVVVGTANVGEVTITNITQSGNNISQVNKIAPEHSNLYGRFVPGSTGTLTIDGTTITE
jgi:predicted ribosomally synthesized peptide with SipW-like signal peptide